MFTRVSLVALIAWALPAFAQSQTSGERELQEQNLLIQDAIYTDGNNAVVSEEDANYLTPNYNAKFVENERDAHLYDIVFPGGGGGGGGGGFGGGGGGGFGGGGGGHVGGGGFGGGGGGGFGGGGHVGGGGFGGGGHVGGGGFGGGGHGGGGGFGGGGHVGGVGHPGHTGHPGGIGHGPGGIDHPGHGPGGIDHPGHGPGGGHIGGDHPGHGPIGGHIHGGGPRFHGGIGRGHGRIRYGGFGPHGWWWTGWGAYPGPGVCYARDGAGYTYYAWDLYDAEQECIDNTQVGGCFELGCD